jgi:serine/threonine-protein kinase
VKEIFQAAIELTGDDREDYLADACAGHPSLQAEVVSLIAAHERPGRFLDTPAVDLAAQSTITSRIKTLVGKSLGRYQILALLGRGGMGEVYKAKDTMLGREVAIKVLSSNFSFDRDRLFRFEQEARAASALNHPNIITIYEFGQEDGIHFIASEFIEGETLRRRIAKGPMNPGSVLEIGIQITGALNAAHEAGIAHRDIKPENIMVRPDGLVKVLDFGLAKLIEQSSVEIPVGDSEDNAAEASTAVWNGTGTGVVLGTVSYMSPEQVRAQKLDARTDLFSLGVVLYEMLSGRSPFASATPADMIAAILDKEPPPLTLFNAEVPEAMERIISQALQKDREERYQTAEELLSDLRSLKSGETIAAPSPAKDNTYISRVKHPSRHWRGVALSIAVVAVVVIGTLYFNQSGRAIESIAVLPFINESGNPETEYLADGMTENVISSLSQLPKLTVRPRNVVWRYKRRDVDPQTAGRELKVEAVLTGQAAQRGDEITISLQLIDVRENRQLWGVKYSGRSSDLLLTEKQIAREITANLRPRLSSAEQQQLTKQYANNAEAHQLYMKGRYFWNQRTGEGHRKAIDFFTQATQLDPAFALAHAGLADSFVLGGGYQISAHEAMSKARASASQALKLDETLAEAHASLAQVYLSYDWNLQEAEASFKRAIDLKPTYETAHHWYAIMLAISGRFPEAIDRIKRAQDLDPVSRSIGKDAAVIYHYAGQYEQAVAQARKTLMLHPDFFAAHSALGEAYLQQGKREEAITELRRADELSRGRLFTKGALGYAYAVSGQRKKAMDVLQELRKESSGRPVSAFYSALLYTGLGQKDAAFEWLEKALEERAYRMIYLKVDPAFASLRSDPRFPELLRRVGLAQ